MVKGTRSKSFHIFFCAEKVMNVPCICPGGGIGRHSGLQGRLIQCFYRVCHNTLKGCVIMANKARWKTLPLEMIQEAVSSSISYREVAQKLGYATDSGGTQTSLQKMVAEL